MRADSYYTQFFPNEGQQFVAWYLRRVMLRDPAATRLEITDGQDDSRLMRYNKPSFAAPDNPRPFARQIRPRITRQTSGRNTQTIAGVAGPVNGGPGRRVSLASRLRRSRI